MTEDKDRLTREAEDETSEGTEAETETIPGWAQTIIDAHLSAAAAVNSRTTRRRNAQPETVAVSHAGRMKSRRYFVWQEDGGNDLNADNGHDETAVTGYTDLFTEVEFDPAARALGPAFDAAGIAWEYTGCSYEPNTGLFHHTWEWEVAA